LLSAFSRNRRRIMSVDQSAVTLISTMICGVVRSTPPRITWVLQTCLINNRVTSLESLS
jgi:hypothetical protein